MPSSFEGNEGNEGNAGNAGGGGGGGSAGWFFADRVDLPFVTVEYTPGSPIAQERTGLAKFPDRAWAGNWYAYLVLFEFLPTAWSNENLLPAFAPAGDWNSATNAGALKKELDDLVTAAQDERADALNEIVRQSDEFGSYFLDLLTATGGYPATAKILAIASFIGGFCAMYYKGQYQRPRPSMLCPALMPPFPVPGHASFPSGHSTQAHLMALCMGTVLENTPPAKLAAMQHDMKALADRIARNREIAGLHYRSDTEAGIALAATIQDLLVKTFLQPGSPPSWYQLAISAAQTEWQ